MKVTEHVEIIQSDRTHQAHCFFTTENTTPQDIISEFNLNPLPKGILCISGGAKGFPPEAVKPTARLIECAIAPLVFEHNLLIIDGGTKAGVMHLIGQVLRKVKYGDPATQNTFLPQECEFETLPLMGFVPETKVTYHGAVPLPGREIELDRNHTYCVLVNEAQDWGEEVECMFTFLDYLAYMKHLPIVHIVANGGRVTIKEVHRSMQKRRHIIVLEGSARASKVIGAALGGASQKELTDLFAEHNITTQIHEIAETLSWLKEIVEYDKITSFDFCTGDHKKLQEIILSRLGLS